MVVKAQTASIALDCALTNEGKSVQKMTTEFQQRRLIYVKGSSNLKTMGASYGPRVAPCPDRFPGSFDQMATKLSDCGHNPKLY